MATTLDSLVVGDLVVTGSATLPLTPGKAATSATLPPVVPDSEAKSVAQLVADFNGLLQALRDANVIR